MCIATNPSNYVCGTVYQLIDFTHSFEKKKEKKTKAVYIINNVLFSVDDAHTIMLHFFDCII